MPGGLGPQVPPGDPCGLVGPCWSQQQLLGAVQALESRADFLCVSFPKVEVVCEPVPAGVQAVKMSHECDVSEVDTPALGVQYFWFNAVW